MTTRRTFLQASLGSSALISLSASVPHFLLRASAAATRLRGERILVVIQLSGGNDGLNTVVPYGDDAYYQNRFTLAIDDSSVIKLNDHLGLHPALRGFSKLLEDNRLGIIQGVGYPNPNRSHFESMDLWHTAHRPSQPIPRGWLGRCIDTDQLDGELPAIHYGQGPQPVALANQSKPAVSIRTVGNFRLDANNEPDIRRRLNSILGSPRPRQSELLSFVQQSATVAYASSRKLEQLAHQKTRSTQYPPSGLSRKLQSVAQLIAAGLPTRIYYVTLDGFDTHSNQAEAHSALLGELAGAIAAFTADLSAQGNDERVAIMTFSEFGRRVRENASRGTDHGTAAPMFVISKGIPTPLIGQQPSLNDLDQGDLKFKINYRTVYAEMLEHWLGIDYRPIVGAEFKPQPVFSRG